MNGNMADEINLHGAEISADMTTTPATEEYKRITQVLVDNLECFPEIWSNRADRTVDREAIRKSWEELSSLIGISVADTKRIYETMRKKFREVSYLVVVSLAYDKH